MRGRRKLVFPAIACLALALSVPARAQDAAEASPSGAAEPARVLRIAACEGDGVQGGEAAAIQSLITSYAVELKMFRVIDAKGQELALREAETAVQLGEAKELAPLVADYILSSRADSLGTHVVFTMDVTKASTGEKKSVSDSFASANDLLLSVRRLTRKLFERQDTASSPAPVPATQDGAAERPASNPAPSLALLAGTWKGDKNLDRVTLLPDGRGFAVLASGVRMSLKATIDGPSILIAQNQPNSPDFYRPGLDPKSARTVAQGARPWRWAFALSADGSRLTGVKESVFVTVNEKGLVSLDNNYVRDAVWTRLYR
jgi:hypothetical protein